MSFLERKFGYLHLIRLGVIMLFALVLTNCANESAPQGGKKDDKPPKPRKIFPENKSLHFKADKIQITFDEFIKPTGFSQVLISPPMDKKPEFKITGKTLLIKLKSALRDSTTYTINFAEDVKDLNEGNTLNNFTYVFSTGDFIDSQKIGGQVMIAKDNSAADGVIVSLYPQDSAIAIKRSKPFYFSKTDKAGNFQINNIKAGKYWLFALKDQNYNYIYDQPNELIAFSDSLIDLTDTLPAKASLYLFEENRKKLSFDGVRSISPGLLQVYLNKPVDTFKLHSDLVTDEDVWYFYPTKDTVNYWYSKYYTKNAQLFPVVNDTLTDTATIELKYIDKDTFTSNSRYLLSIGSQQVASRGATNSKDIINTQELFKPLKLLFNRPVIRINENKAVQIHEDSVQKNIPYKATIDSRTKLAVNYEFEKKENQVYVAEVPDSTYQDLFGTWNKKFIYKFKTNSKDNYGNIHLTLKNEHPEKSYVLRLQDASGEIVKQIVFTGETEKKINLDNLAAGNYKLSAIDDTNKNGSWDSGSFTLHIQPEKVINFKDTYTLKGGWDLDIEVKL